jgi:hypothetical protein
MKSRSIKFACIAFALMYLALFQTGCKKAPPITLACNATPPAVYQGEPVSVTATAGSVSTKKKTNVVYDWSGTGVTGEGTTAKVSTDSLNPGSYTVKGTVKEGKKGKEGLKPGQTAECSTDFSVKEFEPPTLNCAANPSTIKPGDSSTITCTGVSPQNRPLTYSYSASAGTVSGSGNTATFSSTGAPTGSITINCKVEDDKNHSATSEATISIVAPPPPPVPHAQALCPVSFSSDAKRPTRVNNEAKACLDEIALNLQRQPDAKLVVVADATAAEKEKTAKQEAHAARHKKAKVERFAEERAVNVKDYLVTEKGIEASRITVTTGTGDDENVQSYLVPAGANFASDVQGTTPVDENAIKPEARKPLAQRHRK